MDNWLIANSRQMGSVETAVRSLTLFVPGQIQQVEVLSEVSNSALQLLGTWHDSVVARYMRENSPFYQTPHANYVTAQLDRNGAYSAAAHGLAAVRAVELLLEMIARNKGGEGARWKTVIAVESLKVALRATMLGATQRPLPHEVLYERELAPDGVAEVYEQITREQRAVTAPAGPGTWKMPRSGKTLTHTPPHAAEVLQVKVLRNEDVLRPENLLHRLSALSLAGETLTILRPLLYALVAYRYRGRRSWTPWLVGVLVEFAGRQVTAAGLKQRGLRLSTTLERIQLKAKTQNLKWWLLRGEMYERYTRPLVRRLASKFDNLPLLNLVSMLVDDYLYLLDTYYFASASI